LQAGWLQSSELQRVPAILLEQATLFSLELAQLGERLGRSNQKRSGHAGFGEGLPRKQREVGFEGKGGI